MAALRLILDMRLRYVHIGIKSLPKGSLPRPIRPNRPQ